MMERVMMLGHTLFENLPDYIKECDIRRDWRGGAKGMTGLIKNLYQRPAQQSFTDITFLLPNGSELGAHKVILAAASPMFEAQFFGPMANRGVDKVTIRDIDSEAFRRMVQFIYMSEAVSEADMEDLLKLLEAAHFYLLPDLINYCNDKLCAGVNHLGVSEDSVNFLNIIPRTSIYEEIMKKCLHNIVDNLSEFLTEDLWEKLDDDIRVKFLEELQVTRWSFEFKECFTILQHSFFAFGMNKSVWIRKICRRIQMIVSRMEGVDNPKFNLLEFYKQSFKIENFYADFVHYQLLGAFMNSINTNNSSLQGKLVSRNIFKDHSEENKKKYWRTMEFASTHSINNLIDHCEIMLASIAAAETDDTLIQCERIIEQINKATESPKYKEILHFNIMILIQSYSTEKYLGNWWNLSEAVIEEIKVVDKMMTSEVKIEGNVQNLLKMIYECKSLRPQNDLYDCNCMPPKKEKKKNNKDKRETCKVLPGIGCQVKHVVFKATVTRSDTGQKQTYTGSTAKSMKSIFDVHRQEIRQVKASGTCLSKYVRKLISLKVEYTIRWEILKKCLPWNRIIFRPWDPITICCLCDLEKHHIILHKQDSSLNQNSESENKKCRHKEKMKIKKRYQESKRIYESSNVSSNE